MRTYIFTKRERKAIKYFLEKGYLEPMIKYRLKILEGLENDVKLYLAMKKKFIALRKS